jgi:hypothetical protein
MDTMATPQLTLEQMQQLSGAVGQYIACQRDAFRPPAFPLTEEQRLTVDSSEQEGKEPWTPEHETSRERG